MSAYIYIPIYISSESHLHGQPTVPNTIQWQFQQQRKLQRLLQRRSGGFGSRGAGGGSQGGYPPGKRLAMESHQV